MRTVRTSFGQKIIGSFIGAILGIVLFFGSFVVLYLNEGRENLGRISQSSVEISQAAHNLEDGTLICINGSLSATTYAFDSYLNAGNYIIVRRSVEMYAYEETEHSRTQDNFGGSSTTTYTYSYAKKWVSSPQKSTSFKGDSTEKPGDIPSGYDSWIDAMPENNTSNAEGLSIGRYALSGTPSFSGDTSLALTSELVNISGVSNSALSGNYILIGNQAGISSGEPKLGDIRISYKTISADDTGMLLGAVSGEGISAFSTPKNNTLYRFFSEASSRDQMISILETEHKTLTWILRLIGWLMMFMGLVAMTGPVTKFLSVIPFFSRVSGFLFGVAAFFISLVLTTLTVLLSIILHNFWLAIAFVVLIVAVVVVIVIQKRKKALAEGNSRPQAAKRKRS